jgi:hypothetical protein
MSGAIATRGNEGVELGVGNAYHPPYRSTLGRHPLLIEGHTVHRIPNIAEAVTAALLSTTLLLATPAVAQVTNSPSPESSSAPRYGAPSQPAYGTPTTSNPSQIFGTSLGTKPPLAPPIITGSQDLNLLRHRDFAGKPCLTVEGMARPHTTNPNLFDHVINTINACPQKLRLQLCYYKSQQCVWVDVPGRERKEALLGTLPSIRDFRYEFHEQF